MIKLTKKAVRLEKRLREYIIAHEYIHTLVMENGHGEMWQQLMDMVMPDWRKRHHDLFWIEKGVWIDPKAIYAAEVGNVTAAN